MDKTYLIFKFIFYNKKIINLYFFLNIIRDNTNQITMKNKNIYDLVNLLNNE